MDRHFHFNIIQAIWFYLFFVVVSVTAKFLLAKYKVPGLTELVHAA